MLSESRVQADGISLQLVTGGQPGPPFLFLHGLTRRWSTFLPLIAPVSLRFQPWLLDFHGHGRSDRRPGNYRVINYVDDVAAALQRIGGPPVVIYGHSLGAMAAVGIAARLPARVRAIILEDPPFDTMGDRLYSTRWGNYFATLAEHAGLALSTPAYQRHLAAIPVDDPITGKSGPLGQVRDPASLRFMAASFRQLDREALDAVKDGQWLAGYDWRSLFSRITCPVLLFQADPAHAGMLTDADCDEIRNMPVDCTLVPMKQVGHVIHLGRTAEVIQHITSFCESW